MNDEKVTELEDDGYPAYDPSNPEDAAALFAIAAGTGDGYGTADVSPEGIDRSQLRRNLRLTPEERFEETVKRVRLFQEWRGMARRPRQDV